MYPTLGKSSHEHEAASEEAIAFFKKSGKISAEALEFGKGLIKNGAKPIDILDKVEEFIAKKGAACAFPPQMSLNETAAHSCPDDGDQTVLEGQVVKLDVGVHVEGYVTDNAVTVDLSGKWGDLLQANKEALDAALALAVPGTPIGTIGKEVERIIASYGYKPVRNLSGHGLGKFTVHSKPSIPNFDTGESTRLTAGMVLAIEPFVTNGAGLIAERGEAGVFMLVQKKPVRDLITRNALQWIGSYQGLPFARKWLTRALGKAKTSFALKQLDQLDMIHAYPPLVEQNNGVVSQMEKSVVVAEKPIVLTHI